MKRVFAPGVFDVFHIGHLNYLLAASRLGDELYVAVQEDRAVERQKHVELVTSLPERIALIEQFRFVTEVLSYSEIFQGPLLRALKIDVFACGEEYGNDPRYPEQLKTLEYCSQNDIRIARIPRTPHVSSSAVRSKLRSFWSSRAAKASDLPAGVTTLGSFNGDQDQVRQQTDREVAMIAGIAKRKGARSLIDLGCGDGRHLVELASDFPVIAGVDFSEELVSVARGKLSINAPHVRLHVADVSEFVWAEPFDIILLSGVTPCLDDLQLERLLENVGGFAHSGSYVIMRASISIGKRINLVNYFSAELGDTYTAYYRTEAETIQTLARHGWTVRQSSKLHQHRPDTSVWWFEFARAG